MTSYQKDAAPKTGKAEAAGDPAASSPKRRTATKRNETRAVSKGSTDYILSSAPGPRTLSTERIREIVQKVFREREAAKKVAALEKKAAARKIAVAGAKPEVGIEEADEGQGQKRAPRASRHK